MIFADIKDYVKQRKIKELVVNSILELYIRTMFKTLNTM